MAEDIKPTPLPTSGFQDGDKAADKNGRVYKYVADTNSWIDIGVLHDPQVADKSQDGLVTPTIYRKLKLIETLIKNNGVSFESFKISTKDNIKPYFYYFNSSDGLIKFIPEATNKLRIEIDRGVLLSKIATFCCVGPKGEKGEDGESGDDGKPAANEPKYDVSIDTENNIQISANVTTPLDTEISLRLFNNDDEKLLEVLLLNNSITSINTLDGVELVQTNSLLKYDKELGKLTGHLNVTFGEDINSNGLYYKARQKGPKGKKGKDGSGFIEVIEDVYGDSGVRSSEAIIAIRKSGVSDNISFTTQELFSKNVVASITGSPDLPVGDLLESKYVGVQVTTDDCKDVNIFKFKEPELKIPDLNLPSWTPACNCTDTARYQIQRMDWGMKTADKLPFSLIQEAPPPEACCVAAGTLIHTNKGLVPIENLKIGDSVLCPDGICRPVEQWFDNGIKECVELVFSDNSKITCTLDHKFLTGSTLTEADKLIALDQLYKAPKSSIDIINSKDDYKFGYVVGFLYGDGWISNKSIGIVGPDYERDGFNIAYSYLAELFGDRTIGVTNSQNCKMNKAVWSSKEAIEYFTSRGYYKVLKPIVNIKIPNDIYNKSEDFYKGLLTAIVNTDGSILNNNGVNVITTIDYNLALTIKHILDYLGFRSTLKKHKRSKGKFKSSTDCIYRVDTSQSKDFIDFIYKDLYTTKKNRITIQKVDTESIILPYTTSSRELDLGYLAGSFVHNLGYKNKRLWVNRKASIRSRTLLQNAINRPVSSLGRVFFKNINYDIEYLDSPSFAIGYLSAVLERRILGKKEFCINIKDIGIYNNIKKYLNILNIDFNDVKIKKSHRIVIEKVHHQYRLFKLLGLDFSGIRRYSRNNIINLKDKKYVGKKHVYDYKVAPHYMMIANGLILYDCQEDFYWCPNLGDLCTISGSPEAPLRAPAKSEFISGGDGKKGSNSASTSTTPDTPPFKSGFVPCLLSDPNAILLSGGNGANLGTLLENGQIITESVVTNRGHPDIYTINMGFAAVQTEFQVVVEIQIGTEDGTFNGGTPFSNNKDIEGNCILSSSLFLQTETGTITQVVPGLTQDTLHDNTQSTKSRTFTGLTVNNNTNLILTINVNNTLLDCCLPYAIRVTLTSNLKSDASDNGSNSGNSGSGGNGTGDNDNDDDILNPPADSPAADSPIPPPETPPEVPPEFISVPEFGDENFFLSENRDIPLSPDRAYRPPVKEPILVALREQVDQLYIGETLRSIAINATLNVSNRIRVELLNADASPDKYSITFPIDPHDPTINNVDWNATTYLEFERAGSFLANGPLGSGWYFKQTSPFSINTKLTRLNVTARTDTFTSGFMFISGNEFNVSKPSELVIISYATAWNVNEFANKVSGYGSKWIKTVNEGVELPGDGIYQMLMQTNESIIQSIFQGIRKEFNKAFSSVIYLPNGCAEVNIIQTIDGMTESFVGGRCEEASTPEGPTQTVELSFVPTFGDILENDPMLSYTMNVIMTTSDGLPLEQGVSVAIVDSGSGTAVDGVDYTFSDDIISWPIGTPSGTPVSRVINIIDNASSSDNTVIINLSGATNATIVDGIFTLTILHIQTISIAWVSPTGSTSSEFPSMYSAGIMVTTNDGDPLLVTATADVDDTGGTATEGIDYSFTNPETTIFTSGTPSGTINVVNVTILGSNEFDTIEFTLSNGVNCTASGTFELTLLPGGGA